MHIMPSRRDFLTALAAAGAAGVLGARRSLADEAPPETTTIRLGRLSSLCLAPEYAAEELLRAEGFTDIRYVPAGAGIAAAEKIARGEVDFSLHRDGWGRAAHRGGRRAPRLLRAVRA
jgi:NitT/TauT family transport system substrate-binding protein